MSTFFQPSTTHEPEEPILSLFCKLCRAHNSCTFSATIEAPPLEYGMMWSKWRSSVAPHITHLPPSRCQTSCSMGLGYSVEMAVLRMRTLGCEFGLVDAFWIRHRCVFRMIMAFVDKSRSVVIEAVVIWRVWTQRHKNDRMASVKIEVHSPLKASFLATTHLQVGNDFVRHSQPS